MMRFRIILLVSALVLWSVGHSQKKITTDSGLYIEIHEKGQGDRIEEGCQVEVDYNVYLAGDSTKFDSSYDRGFPLKFTIGEGTVIEGWEEAMLYLKEGSVADLILPPEIAYGEAGSGDLVPPNATLWFEVNVRSVAWPPDPPKEFKIKRKMDTVCLESGLSYILVEDNPAGEQVDTGMVVSVHYSGFLLDGSSFDSSVMRDEPISVPVGIGKVIKGWDEGLSSLKVGEKARLIIPYELGYGAMGRPPMIPGYSTLIFDVEVLEIVSTF